MDRRAKRILTIISITLVVFITVPIIIFMITKTSPDKTVIIDNRSEYKEHISSSSFNTLGTYLYGFINKPNKEVYHATIIDGSYKYSSTSWFSDFTVKLKGNDISWKVSIQTLKDGTINGDMSVTCSGGGEACLSTSAKSNTLPTLQSQLPISTDDYIISYQTSNRNVLSIIYYDQAGTGKVKALEKIKSLGFNPDDYTIQYYYGGH